MKKLSISITSLLLVLIACQSDYEQEVGVIRSLVEDKNMNGNTISSNNAISQAISFVDEINRRTRSSDFSKNVSSVYAWRSSEIYSNTSLTRSSWNESLPDTLLYIVNFDNESGFALVSAATSLPGVVAYIEQGTLTPYDEIDNPGFALFLDGYKDYYINNRGVLPQDSSGIISLFHLESYLGPLLTTNWGQRSPYNNYCYTSEDSLAVAGCAAIALTQIAAFHRFPTSFVINAWQGYDYHYIQDDSISFDSIKVDITNGRPLYMRGTRYYIENGVQKSSGHAWVVDGYAIKSLYYYDTIIGWNGELIEIRRKLYQNLIHCNWGWNGNCNGYFIIGAFDNRYNLENDHPESGFRPYNTNNYTYRCIFPNTQ